MVYDIDGGCCTGSWYTRERTQLTELQCGARSLAENGAPCDRPKGLVVQFLCDNIKLDFWETLNKEASQRALFALGKRRCSTCKMRLFSSFPGGLTGYVNVNEDGIVIRVGRYSDEGINLVMDRDYGMDGKLKDARWKFEVQKRWDRQLAYLYPLKNICGVTFYPPISFWTNCLIWLEYKRC